VFTKRQCSHFCNGRFFGGDSKIDAFQEIAKAAADAGHSKGSNCHFVFGQQHREIDAPEVDGRQIAPVDVFAESCREKYWEKETALKPFIAL
jgi:hypothetical protein